MPTDVDARGLYIAEMRVALRDVGALQAVEVSAVVGALGEPDVVQEVSATTDPQPLSRLSESDLRDYVLTAVRAFVTHQVDEHLTMNGARCVDPHPRHPTGFDAELARPIMVKVGPSAG
ncbi:MAG TPA: hypothetical protein VIK52_14205 [Opitutaceae bacterium]